MQDIRIGTGMKKKLNLTINHNVIERSKNYARKNGISVSELIENLLESALEQDKGSFTQKWTGKLKLADKDDSRFNNLKNRYL